MPKYEVYLPVTMSVLVEVEADSEKAAIEAAFDVEWQLNPDGCEIIECEANEWVTRGNVCSAVLNDAYAELVSPNVVSKGRAACGTSSD